MKKALSVLLAAVMAFTVILPTFAADAATHTVEFTGFSDSLLRTNPAGEDIGDPYIFIKTEEGKKCYVEDPDGIYYLATDGNYYTRAQLIETTIAPDAKTYSPDAFDPDTVYALEENSTLSFTVETNEAYNAATALVYINGELASKNSLGEYSVLVDRNLSISVKESVLKKSQFKVVLNSGDGYRVRSLLGENYAMVEYGESFSFRVKILKGYSDADLSVKATRGSSGLEEFLGEDADLLTSIMSSEVLVSNGVDSEGSRIYTINNVTTNCKINVSGVREAKKAGVLDIIKKILKMILDVFGIDTSFLGIESISFEYVTVNIDDSAIGDADLDYMILTGVEDEFKMDQFNVMSGDSVTINFVTYDIDVVRYFDIYGTGSTAQKLNVTWDPGNTGGTYGNVWTANLNRSTGRTYYTTTFIIDNIRSDINIKIGVN